MPSPQLVAPVEIKRLGGRLGGAFTGLVLGLWLAAALGAVDEELSGGPGLFRFFPMLDPLVEGAIFGLIIFGWIFGPMGAIAGFFIGRLLDRTDNRRRRTISVALLVLFQAGPWISMAAYDQGWSPLGPTYKWHTVYYWKGELGCKFSSVRDNAKKELASGKRHAFSVLRALLKDADPLYRCCAAEIFEMMGPDAAPVVPELARALQDGDEAVILHVAKALSAIGPAAKAAIPHLRNRSTGMGRYYADEVADCIREIESAE